MGGRYVLDCLGDDMHPVIKRGDRLVVDTRATIGEGDLVALAVRGCVVVRWCTYGPDGLPRYVAADGSTEPLCACLAAYPLGRVVEVRRPL